MAGTSGCRMCLRKVLLKVTTLVAFVYVSYSFSSASLASNKMFHAVKRTQSHDRAQERNHVDLLVDEVLSPWFARGIGSSDISAAYHVNDKQDAGCFIVQIISGKLYTVGDPDRRDYSSGIWNPGQLFRTRRQNILKLIQHAATRSNLRDFEAAFCLHDCVVSQNNRTTHNLFGTDLPFIADPIPAFTVVSCIDSANIPFPTWDYATGYFENWDKRVQELTQQARYHSWNTRRSQAVFRGSQRSCVLYPTPGVRNGGRPSYQVKAGEGEEARKCGRHALLYQALNSSRAELFNVSVNHGVDWKSFHFEVSTAPAQPDFLSLAQQEEFRYQIIVEGQCQWANRLRDALHMGTVLLIQETQCKEYYGMKLQPFVHYIPVDYWFQNLTQAVLWAESNQEAVRAMNAAKIAYAKQYLASARVHEYVLKLLRRYAGLLKDEVLLRPSAVLVDLTQPLENDPAVLR